MVPKTKKMILSVLAVLICICLAGLWYFYANYTLLSGEIYPRQTVQLNVSGNTELDMEQLLELTQLKELDVRDTGISTEEYDKLHEALSDCRILWSVPIRNTYFDNEAEHLLLPDLKKEEVPLLAYFEKLQSADLGKCMDCETIAAVVAAYPELVLSYRVDIAGVSYPENSTSLVLTDADGAELLKTLACLPAVERVELLSKLPEAAQLHELMETFPDVEFYWQYDVQGTLADVNTKELYLYDVTAEILEELKGGLAYLPEVQQVHLLGSLPEAAKLQELTESFPEISFYWQVELYGVTADVHTEELDLSNIRIKNVDTVEAALDYLPGLKKVIMCNCGISNEEMDALWKRNPQVRFIWSVEVGPFTLRTDETAFMPGKYFELLNAEQCYNLRYCVDMECLDLGHCYLDDCEFVAFMPNMKYLLLPLTGISDATPLTNLKNLVYLEIFTNPKLTDYTPFLTLTALEDLNISYTDGDIEIIKQMTWLKNLWWSVGPWAPEVAQERREILSEALPNTHLEFEVESATGAGWRQLQRYYEMRDIFEMPYYNG